MPRERAFYQPSSDSVLVDEEDDEIPSFDTVGSRTSPPQEEGAPPIPLRSGEPKLMMLKLMKNATAALKN